MANTQFTPGTVITSSWLNDVNNLTYSDDGAALIKTTVGNTSRTVEDKLKETVSVKDFGAKGDGVTDDSTAIQTCINNASVIFFPSGSYLISTTISIPSYKTLQGNGQATIQLKANSNSHMFRIADGATNVVIDGFIIDGQKVTNTGGNGITTGTGVGNTSINIRNNYVKNCSNFGIYFAGTTLYDITVINNSVTGCTAAGITADGNVSKFEYNNNRAWLNGTHGIGIIGIAIDGTINSNVCWDNGQAVPTADNITGYNSGNANITISGNVCRGGLNNGIHVGGSRLNIIGNTITSALFYGLSVWPNTGNGDDITIVGNILKSNGLSGMWIKNCTSGVISGNLIRDNTQHGLLLDTCTDVAITGNTAIGNGFDGFHNSNTSSNVTINGNVFRSNGGDGIDLGNVSHSAVSGNNCHLNTGYGINRSGTEAYNVITGNQVASNTAGQIFTPATTTWVSNNITEETYSVASAATVTLPPNGEFFNITGTTTITSITASFIGRRVTLQFTGSLTVTDGSNLKLAGNFVTAVTNTLTLVSDGASWIECSRSIN